MTMTKFSRINKQREEITMRSVVPFGWQAAFCAARTRAYDPLATLADL